MLALFFKTFGNNNIHNTDSSNCKFVPQNLLRVSPPLSSAQVPRILYRTISFVRACCFHVIFDMEYIQAKQMETAMINAYGAFYDHKFTEAI